MKLLSKLFHYISESPEAPLQEIQQRYRDSSSPPHLQAVQPCQHCLVLVRGKHDCLYAWDDKTMVIWRYLMLRSRLANARREERKNNRNLIKRYESKSGQPKSGKILPMK